MRSLLVFLLLFFVGLCFSAFTSTVLTSFAGEYVRIGLLCSAVTQCVFAFILPAWLSMKLNGSKSPWKALKLSNEVSWKAICGVIGLFVIVQPAMNLIVDWNEHVHLPDALSLLEESFRKMEDAGQLATEAILSDVSWWGLISGIAVVGIITGFSEEIFFRGTLQPILHQCGLGRSATVWGAAIIFSALHFQFFGFVPRLLMGAMFGYLLLWTNSLRTSIFAHAMNNSAVVVTVWLSKRGVLGNFDLLTLGVEESGFQYYALISAFLTVLFLFMARHTLFLPVISNNEICEKHGEENDRSVNSNI